MDGEQMGITDNTRKICEETLSDGKFKGRDERKVAEEGKPCYTQAERLLHYQVDKRADIAPYDNALSLTVGEQILTTDFAHAGDGQTQFDAKFIETPIGLASPDSCAGDRHVTTADSLEADVNTTQTSSSSDSHCSSESSQLSFHASQISDGKSPATSAYNLPHTKTNIETDSNIVICAPDLLPGNAEDQSVTLTVGKCLTDPESTRDETIRICMETGTEIGLPEEQINCSTLTSEDIATAMITERSPRSSLGSPFASSKKNILDTSDHIQTPELSSCAFLPEKNYKHPLDPAEDIRGPQSSPAKRSKSVIQQNSLDFGSQSLSVGPTPKRMTLAAQKRSHERLSAPFRSPLLSKTNLLTKSSPMCNDVSRPIKASMSTNLTRSGLPKAQISSSPIRPSNGSIIQANRPFLRSTRNAASPFKSPVILESPISLAGAQSSPVSSVQAFDHGRLPHKEITALERRAQVLRRALKIRKNDETKALEGLVQKWRSAGRLVSQELWIYLRECPPEGYVGFATTSASDNFYPGTNIRTGPGSSSNWGWDEGSKSSNSYSNNWGWATDADGTGTLNEENNEEDDLPSGEKLQEELFRSLNRRITKPRRTMLPPTPRGAYFTNDSFQSDSISHPEDSLDDNISQEKESSTRPWNLGAMLTSYGIPHPTLGWVEDEEDFID